ncbi:MAG: redoxin domain-containing protein [Rickettsiales bacterium]|nr:redoxin domain-containing protein [Rickettsiales bacterium]
MMLRSLCVSSFAAIVLAFSSAQAAPEIGKAAPDFTGTDYTGKAVKLSDYKDQIVVLEWTNQHCPFVVKQYGSGNMQKLQKAAADKKLVWITINSSAAGKQGYLDSTTAQATFAKQPILAKHYLLDSDGTIGKLYGAKTTPHMFIINKGTLAYMGAIDSVASPDPADIAKATNYVTAALDEITAGKNVTTPVTQPYGCAVKYAE